MRRIKKIAAAAGCLALFAAGCENTNQEVYQAAVQDLERGYYAEALTGFTQVLAGDDNQAKAYRGEGIAYLKLGEYVKSAEAFSKALDAGEGRSFQRDVFLYQATAQYKGGMYEAARDACECAMDIKADAETLYLHGKIQLALDAYEEAAESFSRAYKKEKSYAMSIWIYQAYLERGMEADGAAYLEESLQRKPKDAEDYCRRGEIYYYMKDYTHAQEELMQAINDGNIEAELLLGKVYFAQGDIANARAMYQEYVADEKGTVEGYNCLALCDIQEQDYASALQQLQKGLRIAQGEEAKALLYNQIVIYERQRDYTKALEKLGEYLQLFPNDEQGTKEQAFLQTRLGIVPKETQESENPEEEGAQEGADTAQSEGGEES